MLLNGVLMNVHVHKGFNIQWMEEPDFIYETMACHQLLETPYDCVPIFKEYFKIREFGHKTALAG